jgi:hypothetical protein
VPFRFDLFVQRMKRRRVAEKPRLVLVEKPKDELPAREHKPDEEAQAESGLPRRRLKSRA